MFQAQKVFRQLKDYITDQKSGIKSAFEDKVDPQDFEKIIDSRANDSQLQQDVEKLLQVVLDKYLIKPPDNPKKKYHEAFLIFC